MTDGSSWTAAGRHAGLMVPLFSVTSTASWGIGEIPDLVPLAAWLRAAGLDFVQLLPINEMASGQSSPYAAMSAMAIDPIFIRLTDVPEFDELGGEAGLTADQRAELDRVRRSPFVDHEAVRALKTTALRAAFARFLEHDCRQETERARGFAAFATRERGWLETYAFFRALHAHHHELPWWQWTDAYRSPQSAALSRQTFEIDIRYYQYLQWLADEQWCQARAALGEVGVFGDLPFMVGGDSADVWTHQPAFLADATVGVPPDAFSATGQDWGVPVYRWDVMASEDFRWFRERARRSAQLFDGYRVDHLVGFYRTYARPLDGGAPYFTPAHEPEQTRLGETLLGIFGESGAFVIAEDLGTVPDFVRASLARLEMPGFKVLRWERDYHAPGQPYLEPARYPRLSVATSGTHDTEPMVTWWTQTTAEERASFARLSLVRERAISPHVAPYGPALRDTVLEMLMAAGSEFVQFPVQDIFGWSDRINTPATVGDGNWTYRLPWAIDTWLDQAEPLERAGTLRRWAERYRRP